jgi:high-affinity nickel-transport protein
VNKKQKYAVNIANQGLKSLTRNREIKHKIAGIYLLLVIVNVFAWLTAITTFEPFPLLIGTSVIAYSFGLRHAVDADHIAAIDNVTRKLMQEGKRPVAVGFFFSLGHSTIVVLASVAIALATTTIQRNLPQFRQVGSIIGTAVSATFLFVIALINIIILRDIYVTFKKVKRGGTYSEETLNSLLNQRGIMGRLFRPFFKLIKKSWHMYPLGFLFGLGFDTATEIGLLGITATEATKGLPVWSILIFPLLFTAGMSLVDTTDGVLMLAAYGWAYVKPIRKLFYNMTITFISVLVALLVGGIEAFSIVGDKFGLKGRFWDFISSLSGDLGIMGYFIIGIFVISWLASTIVYKLQKYDEVELTQGK